MRHSIERRTLREFALVARMGTEQSGLDSAAKLVDDLRALATSANRTLAEHQDRVRDAEVRRQRLAAERQLLPLDSGRSLFRISVLKRRDSPSRWLKRNPRRLQKNSRGSARRRLSWSPP